MIQQNDSWCLDGHPPCVYTPPAVTVNDEPLFTGALRGLTEGGEDEGVGS